jgi:double-stranded uracil-DNA glycosylase
MRGAEVIEQMKRGLAPVVDAGSRVLILGTLPGEASLREQRYYANPRNDFWRLLSAAFAVTAPTDPAEQLAFLRERGIALWDVLAAAERAGSLDSSIRGVVANDIAGLLARHPGISRIGFNGTKARTLFLRHVAPELTADLATELLPSSSATPGRGVLSFRQKVPIWTAFLRA